jgi:hypothetical protein
MAYQRKPLGSPCHLCGEPVTDEKTAVRTLNNYLPYIPKIWHRPCFERRNAPMPSLEPALAAR